VERGRRWRDARAGPWLDWPARRDGWPRSGPPGSWWSASQDSYVSLNKVECHYIRSNSDRSHRHSRVEEHGDAWYHVKHGIWKHPTGSEHPTAPRGARHVSRSEERRVGKARRYR